MMQQPLRTDKEVHLRTLPLDHKMLVCCVFCKSFDIKMGICGKRYRVTDPQDQICDEWRYCA